MKCPKCSTKLIVPQPPMAITAEPDVLELAEIDPLQIPMASSVAPGAIPPGSSPALANRPAAIQPGQPFSGQPPFTAQPYSPYPGQYGQPPAKPPAKSASGLSRAQFWLIAGGVIGLLAIGIGGFLIWEYSKQRNSLSRDMKFVVEDGKRVSLDTLKQNLKEFEPPAPPPPPQANALDSGNKVLRDPNASPTARNMEMAELIECVEPSIVRLKVTSENGEGIGSGFFIDREGKILTNYHVVQNAGDVIVSTADGKQTKALGWIIAQPNKDLAIIQIDPKSLTIVPIAIADSLPRRGDEVAAFGAPQGFSFTATKGIISSIRTGLDVKNTLQEMNQMDVYTSMGYTTEMNWIQTTAAISGGNSGGPLVNLRGELVGVNTWTHRGGQNLSFASTLDDVTKIFSDRTTMLHEFKALPPTRINE